MARIAPERTNFFVRSNYQVGVESKPERSVAEKQSSAARALFDRAEQAIRGIEEGVQAEAALRQLWASLPSSSDSCVRTTPISVWLRRTSMKRQPPWWCTWAAELVSSNLRLCRLLKQAEGRLRARLA